MCAKKTRTRKDDQPDKRYGNSKQHKYCGKRKPKEAQEASFQIKLRDAIEDDDDFDAFGRCFMKREEVFYNILDVDGVRETAVSLALDHDKGNFRTELVATMNEKPWLTCGLRCNNGWYWNNDAALINRIAKSVAKSNVLDNICQEYDYDTSKSFDIKREYHKRVGEWRSQEDIKKRCTAKKRDEFPKRPAYVLDYGTQSKYTISESGWDELADKTTLIRHVITIGDEEKRYKIPLAYRIPERLILSPIDIIHIGKPSITHNPEYCAKDLKRIRDKKLEPKPWDDLVITIPYWYYPAKINLDDTTTLGSDAGFLKYYCAGIVTDDCFYVENISPSPEIDRRNIHIQCLMDEKNALYQKMQVLQRLIKHSDEPDKQTVDKLTHLQANYEGVRSNIKSERDSLAWLAANELVTVARMYGARNINIEDLRWVGGSGQSWDYGRFRSCLETVANRYGVNIIKVNASRSSKTDPSTGEDLLVEDDGSRVVVWADESEHDRDGSSGLELACREPYSCQHDRFARVRVDKPCGDSSVRVSVSRSRVHHDKKHRCANGKRRWTSKGMLSHADVDDASVVCRGYRVSAEFVASIRARRDEWREVQRRKNLQRDAIFKFAESSRTVARLSSCRSVKSDLGGEPGCLDYSINQQTKAKNSTKTTKKC